MLGETMLAGALAGLAVDVSLFPVDTVKTRLQSPTGFVASGAFRNVYRGITPVLLGSLPTSALFFVVYEQGKLRLPQLMPSAGGASPHFAIAMASAVAETVACLLRVPFEVWKQRRQAFVVVGGTEQALRPFLKRMYVGWWPTVLRDVAFSTIQCTLWEHLKAPHGSSVERSAMAGAAAGAIAAVATCPLDVWKTHVMLSASSAAAGRQRRALAWWFRGVVPRTLAFTVGGCLYLGSYDLVRQLLQSSRGALLPVT